MPHVEVEPPAFFRRGPAPFARFAFFGILSLALLFLDTRFRYLESLREAAAVVILPLQYVARLPQQAAGYVGEYFTTQRALTEENEALKRLLVAQGPAVQAFPDAREENARLRGLLEVRERYGGAAAAVEVLYAGRDPFAQKVIVSRGVDAQIRPGEAVVDAEGVVGQVTRVYPTMAEVTILTDKDHAVPVRVERSGVRSVLFGAGAGRAPELRFMSPNADVRVGDRLVTSGIDGTYPPGLAVAEITTVERETGQIFARITARPLAGVDRSRHLLVLGAAAALPPRPDEPVAVEAAKKAGKGKRRAP
jgi:rod shape-determining protein MreC